MNFCSHSHVSKNWYRCVEVKYHVLNYLLGGNYVKSNTTVQHLEEAHHLLSFVSSVKQSLTIHIWQDQNYRDMYQRHPDFESFCISFLKLLNLIYCNMRWKLQFTCCHFVSVIFKTLLYLKLSLWHDFRTCHVFISCMAALRHFICCGALWLKVRTQKKKLKEIDR